MKNVPAKIAVVRSTEHEATNPRPDFLVGPGVNKIIPGYHIIVIRITHAGSSSACLGIFGYN